MAKDALPGEAAVEGGEHEVVAPGDDGVVEVHDADAVDEGGDTEALEQGDGAGEEMGREKVEDERRKREGGGRGSSGPLKPNVASKNPRMGDYMQ